MTDFRKEFEKAFEEKYPNGNKPPFSNHNFNAAIWAAKWMANRCAQEVHSHWNDSQCITNQKEQAFRTANSILRLAKELQ